MKSRPAPSPSKWEEPEGGFVVFGECVGAPD